MAVAGAAKRYAQAAFELAKEQGTLDQWESDLDQLLATLQIQTVREFFDNPAIPQDAKQQALASLLPDEQQRYVRNLALLLLERGRLPQLEQVVNVFHELVLEARGVAIARVTTAVELSSKEIERVAAQLTTMTQRDIRVQPEVDPSIIGGIVVRIGDTMIDGSVKTQLAALRQRMVS